MRNALFAESVRFGEFRHSLGIATNVLAARLAHLVDERVFEKVAEDGSEGRYTLTARGRGLATALIALTEWGDQWVTPGNEPILYAHAAGAHAVHARVVCDVCGPLDSLTDIEALPGPGMPEDLAERVLARHRARHQLTTAGRQKEEPWEER